MKTCSIHDCSKKTAALGLCMTHYRRKLRNGTTDLVSRAIKCEIEDCTERAYPSSGYCKKHDRAFLLYGNPLFTHYERAKGQTCIIVGCDREARSKSLCNNHYTGYKSYEKRRPGKTVQEFVEWKREKDGLENPL